MPVSLPDVELPSEEELPRDERFELSPSDDDPEDPDLPDDPDESDDPDDPDPDESDDPDDPDPVEPPVSLVPPPVLAAAGSPEVVPDREPELDRRSTFAQPDPLKTIAGATNALRIAPPHTGQVSGPEAWTPCITSSR